MNYRQFPLRKSLILTLFFAVLIQTAAMAQTTIGRQLVDQYPTLPWGGPTYGLTWLPQEYNSTTKKYPLIIFLHGRGETGDGVWGLNNLLTAALPQKIAQGWDPQAVNPADGQNYQFIVVSPQAPSASGWSYQYGHVQWILKDVMSRYRVDPDRIYVTGLSAGGAGAWSCVTNGPEGAQKFAAIVPVSSAGVNYGSELDSIKYAGSRYGVKVWSVCGAEDAWYSFAKNSTALYNSGTPAPVPQATETGIPGLGHVLAAWNTAYDPNWKSNQHNKNIYEWMLQYKRSGTAATFNSAPVANAGPDQTITLPLSSVQLNGSGTDQDGSVVSYSWSKISGPAAILAGSGASASVTGLLTGTYVFRLTVTDNVGETGYDDVTITVNTAPITGSSAYRIEAENWSGMKGVGTEGTSDAGGGLSVGWIDNTDWMDYTVNLSQGGTYTVGFRVATPATSGQLKLLNAAGTTLATVNVPNTGWWQNWQTVNATVTLPAGQQTLRVLSSSADAWNFNWMELKLGGLISLPNQAPVVIPGPNVTVVLPTASTQLAATAEDPDGTITSYNWAKVAGPAEGVLSDNAAPVASVSGLVEGTYTFRVTVTDDGGASATGDKLVIVSGTPSSSTAPALRIQAENWTGMKGVGTEGTSDDGGGLSVGWIDNTDWMDYSVNITQAGTYTVGFRVASPATSGQLKLLNAAGTTLATVNVPNTGWWQNWQTATATVTLPAGQQTLRVLSSSADAWNFNWFEIGSGSSAAPANQLPTVNAGTDQTITLPTSSVQLSATATDADGTIASYSWTKVSGPAGNFSSTTVANPTFSGLVQGTYTLKVTATDNSGATASDEIVITVNAAPIVSNTGAIRVEAEKWTSMSGVGTEGTSDVGGGLSVGWIDNYDWMDYSVNMPSAGTYVVSFRVASPATSGQLQLRNAAGTVLATVAVPNTGWWQNWQSVSATVTLPAGQQTLRVVSTSADAWNFNYFELAPAGTVATRSLGAAEVEGTTPAVSVETLEIFPNPVSDRFMLKVSSPLTGTMKVQVLDQTGTVQKQFTLQKTAAGATQNYLSAQGLAKGEYTLKVQVGEWSGLTRLVKQ
jgi:hypothetical protein